MMMIAVAYNQSNGDLYRSKCVFKIYVTVKISEVLAAEDIYFVFLLYFYIPLAIRAVQHPNFSFAG